jgi:hypothetical protein
MRQAPVRKVWRYALLHGLACVGVGVAIVLVDVLF